jgi:hypothetical protein
MPKWSSCCLKNSLNFRGIALEPCMAFGYLMACKGVHRTSRGYQGHVHYMMQYKLFNFSAGSYFVFWHLTGQLTTTRPRASLSHSCVVCTLSIFLTTFMEFLVRLRAFHGILVCCLPEHSARCLDVTYFLTTGKLVLEHTELCSSGWI